MVKRLAQLPGVVTSACVTVSVPAQLSVATTAPSLAGGTSAAQSTVVLAGMLVIVGAVRSSTVIVWVALLALPHASVAVEVRAMVKRLAQLPGVVTSACVPVSGPAQLSVATTAPSLAGGTSAAQSTVVLAGMLVIVGAVRSSTVIVWGALLALPHASVAVDGRAMMKR